MSAPSIPLINPLLRVGATTLEFWWDPPASGPVTSYTLSCASPAITETYGPSTQYAIITGLTTGQQYVFTLTATNGSGTSPAAEFIPSTPGYNPNPPITASVIPYTSTNIFVSWQPPVYNGQAPIKYYVIDSQFISSSLLLSTSYGTPNTQSSFLIQAPLSTSVTQVQVYSVNDPGYSVPISFNVPAFSPTSISTCQTWLDSSDTTTFTFSGASTIITWADKSGNDRTASQYNDASGGSTYYELLNGYPGVQFRGSNTNNSPCMSNQVPVDTFSTGIAVFAVYSSLDPTSTYCTLATRTSGFLAAPYDMFNQTRILGGGAQMSFNSPVDIRTYVSTTLFEMSAGPTFTYNEWINASTILTNYSTGVDTYADNSVGLMYYGSRDDKFTFFNGSLNEVLVYSLDTSAEFPSTSRQKVEGYLAWKWGIQGNLPPGHPYINGPPLS
jgi:hypothetical protein